MPRTTVLAAACCAASSASTHLLTAAVHRLLLPRSIVHEMTHNRLLRLVVAMESALADGRYEEAAHLRDEYKKAVQQSQTADRKAL